MILFGASIFGPYSGGHHTEYKPLSAWLVSMPEWLRGQTRNLMGSARVGSNPAANEPWLDGRAV